MVITSYCIDQQSCEVSYTQAPAVTLNFMQRNIWFLMAWKNVHHTVQPLSHSAREWCICVMEWGGWRRERGGWSYSWWGIQWRSCLVVGHVDSHISSFSCINSDVHNRCGIGTYYVITSHYTPVIHMLINVIHSVHYLLLPTHCSTHCPTHSTFAHIIHNSCDVWSVEIRQLLLDTHWNRAMMRRGWEHNGGNGMGT